MKFSDTFSKKSVSVQDKDFLVLLASGLWQRPSGELSAEPSWRWIYDFATAQNVQGIVAEGITVLGVQDMPPELFRRFLYDRAYIARRNLQVDALQTRVCRILQEAGVPYVILKGQAVARVYPKPEIRRSGDVDVLVAEEDFARAIGLLSTLTGEEQYHHHADLHHALHIDDIWCEVHGMGKSNFTWGLDRVLEAQRRRMFRERAFGSVMVGDCSVSVPNPEYNALFLLGHALRHFSTRAVVLKQLCDWTLYLHAHQEDIDFGRLGGLLEEAGLTQVWRKFAAFAVECLGAPEGEFCGGGGVACGGSCCGAHGGLLGELVVSKDAWAVWRTIRGIYDRWNKDAALKGERNFWLHYLRGYKEFIYRNAYLWNISKKAMFQKMWDKFAPLPAVFLKKLFAVGGDSFRRDRFK